MSLPNPLGVDSVCFIYLLEGSGRRAEVLAKELLGTEGRVIVVDPLTLAELVVKPLREGTPADGARTRAAFEGLPGLAMVAVDADLAMESAGIRAQTGLKLPDAIHLAAAMTAGAAAFLTNDQEYRRAASLFTILFLDDLI